MPRRPRPAAPRRPARRRRRLLLLLAAGLMCPAPIGGQHPEDVCSATAVKQITQCMFSLAEPPEDAERWKKCEYAETYFRCFSGPCCTDPNFQAQVDYIEQEFKAIGCKNIQCAPGVRAAVGGAAVAALAFAAGALYA